MESVIDFDSLAAWMDAGQLGSGPIESVQPLAGGTQNVLLRFTRAGRDYVLRRPPWHPRAGSNDIMRREARVLGALAGTAVPHPGLIAACSDETVLGTTFYLMEPVDGFNPVGHLPEPHASSPEIQRAMGLALIDGIVALGQVDYQAVGLGDFGKPDGFLERQVPRWKTMFDSYSDVAGWPGPNVLPGVEAVGTWLAANLPDSFFPGIMHGDYHLANVMYRHDGPELAAIIDWEMATIGDPLLDMGWVLATWPEGDSESPVSVKPWLGFPSSSELVERYRTSSHRDLAAIDWYHALACYKLGIVLEGTHARACAGKAPKATGDKLHARAVLLLERAVALTR